jgi:hypothetical protein
VSLTPIKLFNYGFLGENEAICKTVFNTLILEKGRGSKISGQKTFKISFALLYNSIFLTSQLSQPTSPSLFVRGVFKIGLMLPSTSQD